MRAVILALLLALPLAAAEKAEYLTVDEALAEAKRTRADTVMVAKRLAPEQLAAEAAFCKKRGIIFAVAGKDDHRFQAGLTDLVVVHGLPASPLAPDTRY